MSLKRAQPFQAFGAQSTLRLPLTSAAAAAVQHKRRPDRRNLDNAATALSMPAERGRPASWPVGSVTATLLCPERRKTARARKGWPQAQARRVRYCHALQVRYALDLATYKYLQVLVISLKA